MARATTAGKRAVWRCGWEAYFKGLPLSESPYDAERALRESGVQLPRPFADDLHGAWRQGWIEASGE